MRILLVTSDLPRPGGGVQSLRRIRELSGSHAFSLLSCSRRAEEPRIAALREVFREIRIVPGAGRRFQAVLNDMAGSGAYDCVQLEGYPLGRFAGTLPEDVPRALVLPCLAGDLLRQRIRIARGLEKYLLYRKWKKVRGREKWHAIWSRNVFLMSLRDRRAVESWDIGVRIFLMPPLLDSSLLDQPGGARDGRTVLYAGDFTRPGAVDGAVRLKREIMPRVKIECPGARVLVAGADPPEAVRRLAGEDFVITGRALDGPVLSSAAALAAPLRVAGGVVGEIVEALAAGCPVAATRRANSGVGARDGKQILLADRPEDFAALLVRFLNSPGERERLGRAGRDWAREKFDPEASRRKLEESYRRIAEKRLMAAAGERFTIDSKPR